MEPTVSGASGKIVGALIIGLLVGFAAGVFWQQRRTSVPPTMKNTAANVLGTKTEVSTKTDAGTTATPTESAPSTGTPAVTLSTGTRAVANLVVREQPAGPRVGIANLDVIEAVWIAVREETDGKIGNILGAQKVFAGNNQAVVVDLLRPTRAGGTYRVVAYRDVGDPAFNYREDTMVEGIEGKFKAQ